eukprot:COSAG06_NODE_18534_length_882_cov_4.934866_1_plen_96_part_00
MIIATVTLGVNDECAAALGLPEYGKADAVGGVSGGPAAGLQRNADGNVVYTDADGLESTLHKMNGEKEPVLGRYAGLVMQLHEDGVGPTSRRTNE